MAYLSKQTILAAYKFLSTLSPDPTKQGAVQKVSALRYFLALDMFYKKYDRPCDTRDKNDAKEYIDYVGTVVAIKDDCYTNSFYKDLAYNKDFGVGSNFYSVNVVKISLDNGGTVLDFPRRGNTPLMRVQSFLTRRSSDLTKVMHLSPCMKLCPISSGKTPLAYSK